jgi:endonuclease YncB( thermonuclease family)
MRSKILSFLTLTALICLHVTIVYGSSGEIDAATIVNNIVDGDTFDTSLLGRVRLADINAPEYGYSGYSEAKDFLYDLVYWKAVYLDIDEYPNGTYRKDPYNRLVCVVYIDYNSTHYENVNKAMLVNDKAILSNYPNEFDPSTWTLHVSRDSIPEFPSFLILLLSMTATLLASIFCRKYFQAKQE